MITEQVDKKTRNKNREKLLKEAKLTPDYYIKKTMLAICIAAFIGYSHYLITTNTSGSLPEWISIVLTLIVFFGYISISHYRVLREIDEDVKKWNRWSDTDT